MEGEAEDAASEEAEDSSIDAKSGEDTLENEGHESAGNEMEDEAIPQNDSIPQ